ncbi:hypothetical protein [Sphingomonas sp.]|uniref:phage tail assembly chaperone n=1 Tax=Sphingomonas sp. TaxID=28214 RepID=UPI0025CD3CFD|nr:hypothetical protein [Sphingomonas sp.]
MDFWNSIPPEVIADAKAGNPHGIRAMAKAPKLEPRYDYYMEAYKELGTERQQGMSLGPIPNSAIRQWCENEELDPLETEAFQYVIRTLDNHQREKAAEKMEKEHAKSKAKR